MSRYPECGIIKYRHVVCNVSVSCKAISHDLVHFYNGYHNHIYDATKVANT